MIGAFTGLECELAQKIANDFARKRLGCEPFREKSLANQKLEEFLRDNSISQIVVLGKELDNDCLPDLTIDRKEFFSVWLSEISENHPELIQENPIVDATHLRCNIARSVFESIEIVNIQEARMFVDNYIEDTQNIVRSRVFLSLLKKPFEIVYGRVSNFSRNCHYESNKESFALMIKGDGYFSYQVKGKWKTDSWRRGYLCVEPWSGLHAGQLTKAELLGIFSSISNKRPMRKDVVHIHDLSRNWPNKINLIYKNDENETYLYALVLQGGDLLQQLPPGVFFAFQIEGKCEIGLEQKNSTRLSLELKQNDVIGWTGNSSSDLTLFQRNGKIVVLAATCKLINS